MSEFDDTTLAPGATLNGNSSDDDHADPSLLGMLKAQRSTLAQQHTLDLPVPGWRNMLALRLGPISGAQQARLFERVQKHPAAANVDTVIAACQSVLGRAREVDAWEVLADTDGEPFKLDYLLAEQLGIEDAKTAREVVGALFEGANSPGLALASFANEYLEWARESSEEVNEEFLGES